MADELILFNGLDPYTGLPGRAAVSPAQLLKGIKQWDGLIKKDKRAAEKRTRDENLHQKLDKNKAGVIHPYDPCNVQACRWGLVTHPLTPPDVLQALRPLVKLRTGKEDTPALPIVPGESSDAFRRRFTKSFGETNPEDIPYYLLLVGPPEHIPFEFQYDLAGPHAVGRVHFETAQEYAAYVQAVIDHETGSLVQRKRAVAVFSTAHDQLTSQNTRLLAKPLIQTLSGYLANAANQTKAPYQINSAIEGQATRSNLDNLLAERPALLFSASHGLEFQPGDTLQKAQQGAVVCQLSQPGKPIPQGETLGGDNLPAADLSGLVMFAYACCTAGTPERELIGAFLPKWSARTAPSDFLALLPQRMLARGALAFIGHVARAWTFSYGWPGMGADTSNFDAALTSLMDGVPVGHAVQVFSLASLYANNALTRSGGLLYKLKYSEAITAEDADTWTAHQDFRSYIVLGDPAVRLRAEG